ncbi:DUF4193 family protein [Dactylosporangium sp. NPDC049140]|uniref:DUF4193 family protein n=1 Tax=Dactylosporangium sp. NPDC049140 TaxID=3155647 RepID=UPI0033D82953
MNVDFDAPRPGQTEDTNDGMAALTSRGTRGRAGTADLEDTDGPGAGDERDPADEEMSVPVVPMRADEFRCVRCFLVHHRSRIADHDGAPVCGDCA